MKPQVLFVALAVLAVLAALPLAESKGAGAGERAEDASARAWPCCDACGSCTKSIPPRCQCADAAPRGCHPACRNCVKSSADDDGGDVFRCMDRIANFCKRRCTPAPTTA